MKYPNPPNRPCNNPGDYYTNKRLDAEHWLAVIDKARKDGAPPDDIRMLERKLEGARYVGD